VPKKRPADEPILLPDERVAMAFERFDQRRRAAYLHAGAALQRDSRFSLPQIRRSLVRATDRVDRQSKVSLRAARRYRLDVDALEVPVIGGARSRRRPDLELLHQFPDPSIDGQRCLIGRYIRRG
jgi:hypothetical protein